MMPIRPIDPNSVNPSRGKAERALGPIPSPPPRKRPEAPAAEAVVPPPSDPKPSSGPATAEADRPSKRKTEPNANEAPKGGYGRPPIEHRFKLGNPGGPGRPKGSKSQDTLMREEYEIKQTVRENGRMVRISKRRLLNKIAINRALEKQDPRSIGTALGHAIRLFPDNGKTSALEAVPPDPVLDAMIIRQLLDALSLGEPDPECPDPWADLTGEQPPQGKIGDSGNGQIGPNDSASSLDQEAVDEEWGDDNEPE